MSRLTPEREANIRAVFGAGGPTLAVLAELDAVRAELVQAKVALDKSIADSKERSSKIRIVTTARDALLVGAKAALEDGGLAEDVFSMLDDAVEQAEKAGAKVSRLTPAEVETYRAMAADSRVASVPRGVLENVVDELLAVRVEHEALVKALDALDLKYCFMNPGQNPVDKSVWALCRKAFDRNSSDAAISAIRKGRAK